MLRSKKEENLMDPPHVLSPAGVNFLSSILNDTSLNFPLIHRGQDDFPDSKAGNILIFAWLEVMKNDTVHALGLSEFIVERHRSIRLCSLETVIKIKQLASNHCPKKIAKRKCLGFDSVINFQYLKIKAENDKSLYFSNRIVCQFWISVDS